MLCTRLNLCDDSFNNPEGVPRLRAMGKNFDQCQGIPHTQRRYDMRHEMLT